MSYYYDVPEQPLDPPTYAFEHHCFYCRIGMNEEDAYTVDGEDVCQACLQLCACGDLKHDKHECGEVHHEIS